jgi:entericidin A
MKKLFTLIAIAASSIACLTACNTMQGIGKDIKKAGEAIEDTAAKKTGSQ